MSANEMDGFNEVIANPGGSGSNPYSYANKTNTHLAYEVGLGIQHTVYTSASGGQLIIAAEYRYMNWGPMSLGTTPNQTTHQGPNFGDLETNLIDANISWQF